MATERQGLSEIAEAAELEQQANDQQLQAVSSEQEAPEPAPTADPEIEKARRTGWVPKEEWSGDPDEWISARQFNRNGELIDTIKSLQQQTRSFDERLVNQKKFQEALQKQELDRLKAQRQEAVELADTKKFDQIQGQIDALGNQAETSQPDTQNEQQILNDWNSKNAWIYEETPKSAYALAMFNKHRAQGQNTQEAIRNMETELNRQFPPQNPRRDAPPQNEAVTPRSVGKPREVKLQWGDLTESELRVYHEMGGDAAFGSKEKFLQAAKDTRDS